MLIKIFSLAFDPICNGFDDSEIRDFIKDKEVISIQEFFFVRHQTPYLAFVVKYHSHDQQKEPITISQRIKNDSWGKLLSSTDIGFFNLLREWRSKMSKKEGLPSYIIFTNSQLAHIVKQRPQTLSELSKIDGIGKAKLDKYGKDILSMTKIQVGSPVEGE